MGDIMNVFRILGDVSHTVSKCILIVSIWVNKSAEGVSLITQMLYVTVFVTRYLDLFWVSPSRMWWNFVLKNFYIFSSLYIIFLMLRYARTREREKAWNMGVFCLTGPTLAAPFIMMIFRPKGRWSIMECLWVFSIVEESVCVLPQLLLLRQTTVPTVIDSFYLLTLGSYRAFYILNWIHRYAYERHFDPIAVIFGIVQTAFYVDFAWVYWTRQRVKLRSGGVVDSEDLSRGWLVGRFLSRGGDTVHEEDEIDGHGTEDGRPHKTVGSGGHWGARGISVSADEGVLDSPQPQKKRGYPGDITARKDETANFVEDGIDGFSDDGIPSLPNSGAKATLNTVGNGQEWRDGRAHWSSWVGPWGR